MSGVSLGFAAEPPPNIVVIYTDDQGWTGTSVQMDPDVPESKSDYHQTPNLERLASEGMRFSNAYAEPTCTPSRAALLTGKSPAQLQMTDVSAAAAYDNTWYGPRYNGLPLSAPLQRRNLDVNQDTIAEHLKLGNQGYVTAIFGKWHVSQDFLRSHPAYGFDMTKVTHRSSEYPEGDPKRIFSYTDTAIDFMTDRVDAQQPFYLQLSHSAPHGPFQARQATLDKYDHAPPGANHADPLYAAMTEDLDTSVGMVLDHIDQLGIRDNTYVVYLSDNGSIAALGPGANAPLYHAKGTIFEGGIRVPMIVSGPRIAANSVSDVPVTIRDLFPTFSELAGNQGLLADDVEGASLVPVLENGGNVPNHVGALARGFAPRGEIFFHSPHYFFQPEGFTDRRPHSGVRDGNFKLVRFYGENGQPDQVFLYDLSKNVTETEDPDSPLNLARQMPEKAAELTARLDKYLKDVDASMPYQVWDPVDLLWNAERPGDDSTAWRSVTDVDHYFRERWEASNDNRAPRIVQVKPQQPNLPKRGFRFDGTEGFTRTFFHVSDNAEPDLFDADHSATFELWFRTDALTREQLLFETGGGSSGLAITIGDGDGDGAFNEIRANVRGGVDGGFHQLDATATLDRFADPTNDFMQVALVVSDDDNDRYLELYLNGALVARADGGMGRANRLSWDDWSHRLDQAGLGRIAGDLVDAGLTGNQPFAGGNFRGEISLTRFANYALNSDDLQQRYNQALHPVDFGIRHTGGDAAIPGSRPVNLAGGRFESAAAIAIHERSGVLAAPLEVDALITGPGILDDAGDPLSADLEAGREYASYLVHFDAIGDGGDTPHSAVGSIAFSGEIIALQIDSRTLANADSALGSIGIYPDIDARGFRLGEEGTLEILADRKTLTFDLSLASLANDELIQFRVLTTRILEADFDESLSVNSRDLDLWKTIYGTADGADADADGETAGRDFLIWQRQTETPVIRDADFDDDGVVDPEDLRLWEDAFGVDRNGDANASGDTTGDDFLIWQQQTRPPTIRNADFDNDGRIDSADLLRWETGFGRDDRGDANASGNTAGDDFLIWQQQTTPTDAATAVPEPAGAATCLVTVMGSAVTVRRRRST